MRTNPLDGVTNVSKSWKTCSREREIIDMQRKQIDGRGAPRVARLRELIRVRRALPPSLNSPSFILSAKLIVSLISKAGASKFQNCRPSGFTDMRKYQKVYVHKLWYEVRLRNRGVSGMKVERIDNKDSNHNLHHNSS